MFHKYIINDEAIPVKAPKPSALPQIFSTQSQWSITPEKNPVKVINEGRQRSSKPDVKKKVAFPESHVKDTKGATEILTEDCLFSATTLNSTKSIVNKIEDNKTLTFDKGKALQEIQASTKIQQNIAEETSGILNYKLTDTKYKDLISIEVDENDILQFQTSKMKWKSKIQNKCEKPNVFDLWFKEDFVTETPNIDFNIDLSDTNDAATDELDQFNFLFDLYKCNEIKPFR